MADRDRPDRNDALTLEEAARVAGHARWIESALFAVVGGWVKPEGDPAVKVFWATRSRRHGDHATGWRDRQPRVAHLDPDALAVPAGEGTAALVRALQEMTGADATVARLEVMARVVLPGLVAAYRMRTRRAHDLADGPTLRWTALVVADEEEAQVQARELLLARMDGSAAGTPRPPSAGLEALGGEPGGILGLPRPHRYETM